MCDIVSTWIQNRLGVVIDAESLSENTRDGQLLAKMLNSYGIINDDQLEMIVKSNTREICVGNFQNHIVHWLQTLGITLEQDELDEIVDAKGVSSICLFYRVFLELNDKDNLHFLTQQRLNVELRPTNTKFTVTDVEDSPCEKIDPPFKEYSKPLSNSYDIVHWHQDRLESLVNKCRSAREEYMIMARARGKRISSTYSVEFSLDNQETRAAKVKHASVTSLDQPYDELVEEQKKVLHSEKFTPNIQVSKNILKKIRLKQQKLAENAIFKTQLHKELLMSFWAEIEDEEENQFNAEVAEKLLKQSLYEKQMVCKIGEVKMQKEVMIQNKQIMTDAILKEKEAAFVDKLLDKNEEFNAQDFQYYLEKERTLQLHRKIYQEKLRLKAEKNERICSAIIRDICNAALKECEYKELFGEEPSSRLRDNWRKIFVAGESYDDSVIPLEKIIQDSEPYDKVEDIIHKEIERQDKLDERDFESYMNFECPWELDSIDVDEDILNVMNSGMSLLGYIVYSLLEAKYPKPLAPSPPDLSKIKVAACINGLNEVSCLPLLQKMLNHQRIEVIEMQDAINFCVESFKNEIKVEDDDTPVEIKKRKPKVKKEVKSKKQLKSKSKQTDEKLTDQEVEKAELVDKIVQTPKSYPCEEITLSPKAELGEIAYNELAAGRPLTDYLLVAMFVELLMSKQDMKGWVLINYPTTYEQAALLEEALTGLPIPGISNTLKMCKSIAELADVNFENNRPAMYEENELLRRTSLLTNPVVRKDLPFYESALTAYIKIIPVNDKCELPQPHLEPLENVCPLDRFYSDMGCNYSMYYKSFDFNAVKYLAKLIVGDYSIPPKSSVELLGDTIRYINADKVDPNKPFDTASIKLVKKGDKKEMERKEKVVRSKAGTEEATLDSAPERTTKKGKQKKELAARVIIVHADKFTQIPEAEIEEIDEEEDREPPKPGEPGWEYVRLKLPEKLQVALASLWENLEDVYKENFCQVLFSKRVILNAVVPYANYAKECMKVVITKPDDKQLYLRKFQETYNAFDEDIRSDEEFKAELHCRVNEMREKLIAISDRKMMENEQERVTLIDKRWAPKQLVELVNNYMNGFQLELDRCVDTLILINDYYSAMVLKMTEEETISKENLTKYDLDDQTIAERMNNVLIKVEDNGESTFLPQLVEDVSDKALAFVSKNYNLSCSVFERVKALFSPQAGKERPKTPKKEKKSGKNEKNLLSIFEPSEEVKTQSEKIFGEWRCALDGETARVTIRMKLLKADLARSIGEIINTLKKTFHGLLQDITSKYRTEVDCVVKACSLLDRAIEEEVPIQEELVILDDRFCVDPENILFPDVIHPEPPFCEPAEDLRFNISQLESMMAILFDLAPSGVIPERCFVFLLQDMIFNDDQVMAPKYWEQLEPSDVEKLSAALFGQAESVQWKEFIVYNLMVPFPNAAELLSLLRKFAEFDPESTEVVNEKQFFDANFWFGDQSSVKRLLFNLYRVGEGKVNYTAMLLDFCKDLSSPAGLAKALALSLGKAVCWDEEIGRKYADEALEKRRLHDEQVRIWDEERQERTAHTIEILESIIDQTVHQCESIIIEDWPKPENSKGGSNPDVANDENKTFTSTKKSIRIAEDEPPKVEPEDTKRFSNVAIDFEENCSPSLMYFVPLDAVLAVLTSALPWRSKVEHIEEKSFCEIVEDIYNRRKRPDFNYEVFSHEFLNDHELLALLSSTTKFLVKNPPEIVHNLLRQNEEEK